MYKARKILLSMLFVAILIGSCAGQPPPSPTPDINDILTQSVGTFAASFFGTQTAMVTPATPTPLNTPTFIPTSTPMPLPSPLASPTYVFYATVIVASPTGTQYTPTANPSTLAYGCNNLTLINDLGNSSGSTVQPEEHFTTTWQVANSGTCNWLYGYTLVPISGTNLAEDAVRVNNPPVPPGEWRKITIHFTAPKGTGTYTQYWRLTDGAGHAFGATLGVTITVKAPSPTDTSYP